MHVELPASTALALVHNHTDFGTSNCLVCICRVIYTGPCACIAQVQMTKWST